MGIRVYYGLKTDFTDMAVLNRLFSEFQKLAKAQAQENFFHDVGSQIATQHDSYVLNLVDQEPELNPSSIAYEMYQETREQKNKTSSDEYWNDYTCEVNFYTMNGKTLIVCRAEKDFYQEILEKMDDVSEYGYWNNTDKPDHISDDEWDIRRSEWVPTLDHIFRYKFMVIDDRDLLDFCLLPQLKDLEQFKKYYPSIESRINEMAGQIAVNRKFKDQKDINITDVSNYLFSSQRKDDVKAIKLEIQDRLTDIDLLRKLKA